MVIPWFLDHIFPLLAFKSGHVLFSLQDLVYQAIQFLIEDGSFSIGSTHHPDLEITRTCLKEKSK